MCVCNDVRSSSIQCESVRISSKQFETRVFLSNHLAESNTTDTMMSAYGYDVGLSDDSQSAIGRELYTQEEHDYKMILTS